MDPLSLIPGPDLGASLSLPLCASKCTSGVVDAGKEQERKKKFTLSKFKYLVGPDGQGKSQSQDFIDELRGLGRMLAQILSLACWYLLLSLIVCRVGASCCFLMLQIVDSRPS